MQVGHRVKGLAVWPLGIKIQSDPRRINDRTLGTAFSA